MEKKERKLRSSIRGIARFCAVQALYKSALCNCKIADIISEFNKNNEILISENISVHEMDVDFFRQLLEMFEQNMVSVDNIILSYLSDNWNLERICSVTKCILRLGITELMFFKEIPSNVIFNEYIEIAKAFFEKKEVSFINGLLNRASLGIRSDTALSV
jgi:N utilization substance protein B